MDLNFHGFGFFLKVFYCKIFALQYCCIHQHAPATSNISSCFLNEGHCRSWVAVGGGRQEGVHILKQRD